MGRHREREEEPAESEWHPPEPEPEPEMLTSSVASLTGAEERRPSLSGFKDIRAAALMEKSLLGICEEANPKLLAKLFHLLLEHRVCLQIRRRFTELHS